MKFYKNFTNFQKGFFLFFIVASLVVFFIPAFLPGGNLTSVLSVLGVIGIICTISGVLVSIYTAKASISGYGWWWTNTITFAIIGIASGLYGQFIENLFILLPLQIYGFIAWKMNMKKNKSDEIEVKQFTLKQWVLALIILAVFWVVYGYFLQELPFIFKSLFGITISADPQIVLDSFTAVTTIAAVYLTGKRFVQQWNIWIACNGVAIVMFLIQAFAAGASNPSMLVADLSDTLSYVQYLIGTIYGYILWKKMYKKQRENKAYLKDSLKSTECA
ncbi:MAG: nicotinamide riboside transporter PnuC [Clostridium perfringens]|nr:nicotinamide riboside transporter PnuC [Clostridium perfringens]